MEDMDVEQQEPFPVDRDGRRIKGGEDRPDGDRKMGCCEKFQRSVSKWMLPEDARSKYLERANCCPPPIFIILISIAEVALPRMCMTHIWYEHWQHQYGSCDPYMQPTLGFCCHGVNYCIDLL